MLGGRPTARRCAVRGLRLESVGAHHGEAQSIQGLQQRRKVVTKHRGRPVRARRRTAAFAGLSNAQGRGIMKGLLQRHSPWHTPCRPRMISLAQERGGGSERNAAEMNDFLFFLTRASRSAFPRRKIPETAHASPCFNADPRRQAHRRGRSCAPAQSPAEHGPDPPSRVPFELPGQRRPGEALDEDKGSLKPLHTSKKKGSRQQAVGITPPHRTRRPLRQSPDFGDARTSQATS